MSTQAEKKPGAKHADYIRDQLSQARGRVRLLDLSASVLGLLAGLLAFVCLMVVLDALLVLSAATRQFAMLLFVAGAGFYLWVAVLRPLRMEVNPRFAARELEKTLPRSRNHVVSWIDLEEEKLPGVFRAGLEKLAAHDLHEADLEEAIPARHTWAAGAVAATLFALSVLLLVLFGPRTFASHLGRALGLPIAIAKGTRVTVVKPGNHVATIGTPVVIVARVEGRPLSATDRNAPSLVYRHDEAVPPRKRPLTRDDATGEWATTLGAAEVGNGFLYKVTAGDDETAEYTVTTRAAPLLSGFVAVYRYRPYVGRGDVSRTLRKLDDLRGTEVTISVRANRPVTQARMEIDGGAAVVGEILADPHRLRFKTKLDRPGRYKLRYTALDGESYADADWNEIVVRDDLAPTVRLTLPGKDITAPINGTVELEGEATDDIGLAGLTLQLALEGKPLASRPYLEKTLGKPATPRRVEYKEVLPLAGLGLKPSDRVEYWLEARDACDSPKPNVSRTPSCFITLEGPQNPAEQKKQEEQARQKNEEDNKKQEEMLKQEASAQAAQKEKEDKQAKEDAKEREQGPGNGKPQDNGKGKPDKPENGKDKDQDTQNQADNLREALDKQGKGEKKEGKSGEGKGEDEKPGEKKDAKRDEKPGEAKGGNEGKGADEKPGEKKDEGKGNKPGEGKGGGDGKGMDDKPGEKKDGGKGDKSGEGKGDKSGESKGEGKPGDKPGESKGDKPGEGKGDKPGEGKGDKPGEAKGEGKPGGQEKAEGKKGSEGKPSGEGKPGQDSKGESKGEGKASGEGKPPAEGKGGDAKSGDAKGEGKPAGPKNDKQGEAKPSPGKAGDKGEGKPGGQAQGGPNEAGKTKGKGEKSGESRGEAKPAGNEAGKAESKPGDASGGKAENATAEDARNHANKAKQGGAEGEESKRALEAIRDRATDPQARQAAADALGMGGEKGKDKGPGEGPPGAEAKGKGKGDEPGMGMDPGKDAGMDSGAGKPGGGAASPGAGKGESRGSGGGVDDPPPALKEKPRAARATMMQLEEFKKRVDADILKDAKMSREQFEKFLRDYEALAKNQQRAAGDPDDVKAGTAAVLPSVGGTTTPAKSGPDAQRGTGTPRPPAEYRDAYGEFLRRINRR